MMPRVTELEVEIACGDLRKIIDAAENSNQTGEDAAVIAADAPRLRRAIAQYAEDLNWFQVKSCSAIVKDLQSILGAEHFHVGPHDRCRLCLQDVRDSAHRRT